MIVMAGLTAWPCRAEDVEEQQIRRNLARALSAAAVKAQAAEPDWAKPDAPPLFTFAWISDLHLTADRLGMMRQAFACIDEQIKPHFVIFTGDNCAYTAPLTDSDAAVPPLSLRRQETFKQLLDAHLKSPAVVIPGDNWPTDFEKVFGARQFSFNCGGVRFMFTSLDRSSHQTEGCAIFDEPTWQWMQQDLQANTDRPTLFVMHESLLPPSFLDAERTQQMLGAQSHVIGALAGHMHREFVFHINGLTHLIAPALGPHPTHPFKVARVYPHAIIFQTIEYDAKVQRFALAPKWQKIDIPETLRGGLRAPNGPFAMQRYSSVPPHPHVDDPSLLARQMELVEPILKFTAQWMTMPLTNDKE